MNEKLKKLKEQFKAKITESRAIDEKAATENRVLTEAEQTSIDTISKEIEQLKSSIEREEKLIEQEQYLNSIDPQKYAASGDTVTNPEDTNAVSGGNQTGYFAADESALFDGKGKRVEVYGGLRDSNGNRVKVQGRGKKAFFSVGEQLQAIQSATVNPGANNPQFEKLYNQQKEAFAALGISSGGTDTAGFLIDPEFTDRLLDQAMETGVLANRVDTIEIGANKDRLGPIPMLDETSRADGSLFGGINAYWTGETATPPNTEPKFKNLEIPLVDLKALMYASDNMLEDATQLTSVVNRFFPNVFGYKLDRAIVRGSGAGMPLGTLNSGALVTIPKEDNQDAGTIKLDNVLNMYSRLNTGSLSRAFWSINQDCFPELFNLSMTIGTGGVPVWLPPAGASGNPYSSLFGLPVIPVEHNSTVGTVGDIMLQDLTQYIMIRKGGIRGASSIHVQFITDETTFRWKLRTNGQPSWDAPKTPAQGQNTVSPFIALATRN